MKLSIVYLSIYLSIYLFIDLSSSVKEQGMMNGPVCVRSNNKDFTHINSVASREAGITRSRWSYLQCIQGV